MPSEDEDRQSLIYLGSFRGNLEKAQWDDVLSGLGGETSITYPVEEENVAKLRNCPDIIISNCILMVVVMVKKSLEMSRICPCLQIVK